MSCFEEYDKLLKKRRKLDKEELKDRLYMLIWNEREIQNEFDLVEKTQLIEERKIVIVY